MSEAGATASSGAMEWAAVAPGRIVVATAQQAWVHQPVFPGYLDMFDAPMQGAGSALTTRRLLDGAIAAAAQQAPARDRPPLTPARWAWRLAISYHTTHATPRLMAIAAERFAAAGRDALAAWARQKATEESGHDQLALRDLEAMGYGGVVEHLMPPVARALVTYFEARVTGDDDPVGCAGYAYTIERLALLRGRQDIAAVEAILPPGVKATRCLHVHSAVGSDARHVEEAIALVAGLDAAERSRVARACYETSAICFAPREGGDFTEEALVRALDAARPQNRSRRKETP